MTNPGCKGCTERYVTEHSNCHATCERYLKWREERQAQLEAKYRDNMIIDTVLDMKIKLKRKK